MAQRYGGKFSPDGSPNTAPEPPTFEGAKARTAGARTNILFLAPLPLVFSIFGGGATSMAVHLFALAILLLSAWLTREGLAAEDAYNARSIAKRPAFPRKIFASVLMGVGLATGAALTSGLGAALVIGVVGAGLHSFSFGLDPLRDKGAEGVDQFQQDRVAKVVDEAEDYLTDMARHIDTTGDRALQKRVGCFQTTARRMMRQVEADPRDLTGARKFLGIYLKGARDAAAKFAPLWTRKKDQEARQEFVALLDDLETNFAAKTDKLLSDDRTDMDIEIKVLRDRLAREGVAIKPEET